MVHAAALAEQADMSYFGALFGTRTHSPAIGAAPATQVSPGVVARMPKTECEAVARVSRGRFSSEPKLPGRHGREADV